VYKEELEQAYFDRFIDHFGRVQGCDFNRYYYNPIGTPHVEDPNHMLKNFVHGVQRDPNSKMRAAVEHANAQALGAQPANGPLASQFQNPDRLLPQVLQEVLDPYELMRVAQLDRHRFSDVIRVLTCQVRVASCAMYACTHLTICGVRR
jgi:hypothetical protein